MTAESLHVFCSHGPARHRIHILKWGESSPHKNLNDVPVFCVHALTRIAEDFEAVAQSFSPRPVYAAEMIGRGGSPWLLDAALYTYPHYVDDCVQALDALNLKEVDWLGTSMGGLIGMIIAANHPKRIRRLILNDVGPFLPFAALQRIGGYLGQIQRFSDLEQAYRYCRTVYVGFGLKTEETWREFTRRSLRQNKDGSWRLHYDPRIADAFKQVRGDVDLWPVYDQVRCPTLVLRGAMSDVLLEKDAQRMTETGPRARVITFEGCGHAPALVEEEQIKAVKEFLES
ncbi:MAG: alpha/beta hydrolase [Proteobacteria bacterium]|nr:alpha/beta hydrolase [Pseudomonadota bacterium]